jgi:integrase
MKQFTDLGIRRLKTTGKRYHVTEGGGLYLIINAAGTKSWSSYYRAPDGKRRWHPIGDLHNIDLVQAREKNREVRDMAKKGIDLQNTGEGLGIDPTLQQIYDLFMKKAVDRKGNVLRPKTISEYRYIFEADILPYLGKRKIRELRKRDIIPVLEKVIDRGATNQANQVYRRLQRVMAFAAARDIIEFSPMTSMEPVGTTNRRDRVLSDNEVKTFMSWMPKSVQAGRILKLILITGVRPGEAAGILKSEITGNWWTIPKERTKTGIPHRVYLTKKAKEYLPEGNSFTVSRHSVGQCLRRATNPETKTTDIKKRGGQPCPLPLQPFVPHDLRRTMATGLASIGFSDEVINALQGRAKLGIIGTYNLHTYDTERQKAAKAWERKLLSIMNGTTDNVVPMVKRK